MRLAVILSLMFLVGEAFPQACGYINAKFDIRNADGHPVGDARLKLVRFETNDSILWAEREMTYSVEASAFKVRHGMCGSHYKTRLLVSHAIYETFESIVDLPLNSPRSEHVFIIILRRKGRYETASIEQWAALQGVVEDAAGKKLSEISVALVGGEGARFETISDKNGLFSFSVRKGTYQLEAVRKGGSAKIRLKLDLGSGPRWETIKLDGLK